MAIKYLFIVSASVLAIFSAGCCSNKSDVPKFQRVFCWGVPNNEENARKYAEIGVTDIVVKTPKQYALAVKYGMNSYCGTFSPAGPHPQVISPAEQDYYNYINGADLDSRKIGRKKFREIVSKRRIEKNHRFGGEPEHNNIDTIHVPHIACFNSDKGHKLSRKKIDDMLAKAVPGVKGIYFDFIGYTNYYGCYCKVCLQDYRDFLQAGSLPDTQDSRNIFYRTVLVDYYNAMIDYVKSKRPDFKVVVHIYPVFRPDPLYANRTKADYCGHTVAWYFSWPLEKVAAYTKTILKEDKNYFPEAEAVPFVGLNGTPGGALAYKSPEVLEKELQTILAAGGRTLMVCTGSHMIKPGCYEVFKKYGGKSEK